jgi:hypothetical protein
MDEGTKYILSIIGVLLFNAATLYTAYKKLQSDIRVANSQARSTDGDYVLDIQTLAKNALDRQKELEEEIKEYKAIKQPDFELTVIFSIIPPAIKKTSIKAVRTTRTEALDVSTDSAS